MTGWVRVQIRQDWADHAWRLARLVCREPFRKRSWAELGFFLVSSALAGAAALILAAFGVTALLLSVVFVGIMILAGGLRAARGFGRWQRQLATRFLGENILAPEPFERPTGIVGMAALHPQ